MTVKATKRIDREALERAADCLKTLAHPVRLQMIELLLEDRYSVGELAESCAIRPNVASEHLRLMEHCRLLRKDREGRNIYYRVNHVCVEQIMACIRDKFDQQ